MTNFDKMEQNFVALTEEELMEVDGGSVTAVVVGGVLLIGVLLGAILCNNKERKNEFK